MSPEDQAEWELSRAFRRMYLALRDAGEDPVPAIEEALLEARRRADPPRRRCTCRGNPYEAVHCVKCAFEEIDEELGRKGDCRSLYPSAVRLIGLVGDDGEAWVCSVIRRRFPFAPSGFSEIGFLEGTRSPKQAPPPSPRGLPHRINLG